MTWIRLALMLYFFIVAHIAAYGCPENCMQNPVEGLLEAYEDMVDVLLVLEIFLIEDS